MMRPVPVVRLIAALAACAAVSAASAASPASASSAASAANTANAASAASAASPASADTAGDLAVAARTILGEGQGAYVESSDGTVLLAQAAARPVHPASVSKVPSTLALLAKLGPEYRFETRFIWSGPTVHGAVQGDLTVRSDGDPSFVDEDALLVARHLNELGIRQFAGTLRPSESPIFDWLSDPDGVRLAGALGGRVTDAAWQVVRAVERDAVGPGTGTGPARPAVRFVRAPWRGVRMAPAALTSASGGSHELVYRSQPLISLAKGLNDYSNNIFDSLVDAIGGAAAVEALARSRVPPQLRNEIVLADAAGADPRNRLSPRAAVQLLRALERELAATGHTLSDVLPVAGVDTGTLEARFEGAGEAGRIVGKTGTYGSYGASALIGAIRTRDHGTVYFAILDHGVPVPVARRRQDRFVRVLLAREQTTPWTYVPDRRPAVARAQIVFLDRPAASAQVQAVEH